MDDPEGPYLVESPESFVQAKLSTSTVEDDTPYRRETFDNIIQRQRDIKVLEEQVDVTPKPIEFTGEDQTFVSLRKQADAFLKRLPPIQPDFEFTAVKRNTLGQPIRVHIEDVIQGVAFGLLILYENDEGPAACLSDLACLAPHRVDFSKYIKIVLKQSRNILLYEQRCLTVPAGSEDALIVDKENKAYEYVTKGRGRLRRKADAEAQTTCPLYKSREANTDKVHKMNTGSFVSNFEMFDTYQKLKLAESEEGAVVLYDDTKTCDEVEDPFECIVKTNEYQFQQMIMERVLAGNVFKEQQRRFRNMITPDLFTMEINYLYEIRVLWKYGISLESTERLAVSCISWCPSNGDIVAIGYGIFTCAPNFTYKSGNVRIWNIKNPMNPEKILTYSFAVVAVEFSPFRPQLLAVGLYNGTIEVRDISLHSNPVVAVSHRDLMPSYEPVMDIKWISLDPGEKADVEPFLTVSQDGSIMKHRLINSPHLLTYVHAVLDRVEGVPEGLPVRRPWNTLEAVRNPQCLCLTLDPTKDDIFYVCSNEGAVYRCSTNYPQQHLSIWQTHQGATCSMEFSPWSPKLFLTAGDDWCIRIWLDGIFKPLVTLVNKMHPINSAVWSKTHSTIIVSTNRKTIDVWDIRRSILAPVSSTKLEKANITLCKFSNCGRSLIVGNEKGNTFVCALEDMPFPTHFQYEELQAALFKAVMPFPELVTGLKSIGYFGYPKQQKRCL